MGKHSKKGREDLRDGGKIADMKLCFLPMFLMSKFISIMQPVISVIYAAWLTCGGLLFAFGDGSDLRKACYSFQYQLYPESVKDNQ